MGADMASRRANHLEPRPPSARVQRNRAAAGGLALVVALLAVVLVVVSRDGNEERVTATGASSTAEGPVGADRTAATGGSPSSTAPPAPGGPAAPGGDRGRRGSGQAVTLAFGGDVHFEGQIRSRLSADPSSVLAGVAPLLRAADVAVVNLETAITTRGTKAAGKQFHFRAPPSAFGALKAGGVDVASMANNHGMDFGTQGLEDSLDAAADARFPVVGIGRDAGQAYRPFLTEVKGQRIALLGATQVLDDNLRGAWTATDDRAGLASAKEVGRMTAAVRDARARADTVVVFLHWGTEGATCPNPAQPELARVLAEAGADVIVGGHAHRLQGAGRLGPAFVAYGLGNFVFYTDAGPGAETGVLTVTVTGRDVEGYRWAPARLVGQLPKALQGAAATQAAAAWDRLRPCTGLDP